MSKRALSRRGGDRPSKPPTATDEHEIKRMIELSTKRKRRHCTHKTVYNNDQLVSWLLKILPGWEVFGPSVLRDDALSARCPSDKDRKLLHGWLRDKGCEDPDTLIDGACEPFAVGLSKMIKQLLQANMPKKLVADAAHEALADKIYNDTNELFRIFEGFEGGFDSSGAATWDTSVWGEQYKDNLSGIERIAKYVFGGEQVESLIKQLAKADGDGVIPVYILNYIFDGSNLSKKQLENDNAETAQYSCHAIGLVLDGRQRIVVIADPNGGLVPGGNMENLAVPFKTRRKTTFNAQYDIDCANGVFDPVK